MTYYGYKINPKNNHIMLHEGESFEFLKEHGYETGNDSFQSREDALKHAREQIKKNPAK